ncbi:MAG: hypothetical protein U9P10_14675 [Thermodesulfobacteriota bacterium]|nr:hypothetical protein [Thermodesulfobacteriota bacterium]
MVELSIGGQSCSVLKKLPPETIQAFYTLPLDEFKVNWETVVTNAESSLDLQWRVTGARYDTTGLVKIFAGETYVSEVYDIITLPGKNFTKSSSWQDITIIKDYQLDVAIEFPGDGLKTGADFVKVTNGRHHFTLRHCHRRYSDGSHSCQRYH